MTPGMSRPVSIVLFGVGILVMLIGQGVENIVVRVLGLLLLVAGLVIQFIFWRCPACGRYLGRPGWGVIAYCPHCGEPL